MAVGPVQEYSDNTAGDYFIIAINSFYGVANTMVMVTDSALNLIMSSTYVGNGVQSIPSSQSLVYCKYANWIPYSTNLGGTMTIRLYSDTQGTFIGYLNYGTNNFVSISQSSKTISYYQLVTCSNYPSYGIEIGLTPTGAIWGGNFQPSSFLQIQYTTCGPQDNLSANGYCTQGTAVSSSNTFPMSGIFFLPLSYYQSGECLQTSSSVGSIPALLAYQQCLIADSGSAYRGSSTCTGLSTKTGFSSLDECRTSPGMYYCSYNSNEPLKIPFAPPYGESPTAYPIFPACGAGGQYINYVQVASTYGTPYQTNPVATSMGLCPSGQSCRWDGSKYACTTDMNIPDGPPNGPPNGPGGNPFNEPNPPGDGDPPDGGDSGDSSGLNWTIVFILVVVIITIFVVVIIAILASKKKKKSKVTNVDNDIDIL